MIRIIQIIVFAILIYLVFRLVKLIMRYAADSKTNIDGREKEREEIRKKFENIEEAQFREIKPEDEDDFINKDNG